jgi:hypothetical protein
MAKPPITPSAHSNIKIQNNSRIVMLDHSEKPQNEEDEQDRSETASESGTASEVVSATAEQEEEDDNQNDQAHVSLPIILRKGLRRKSPAGSME